MVLTDDAKRFADQMGIRLFETSAKDNINVEEMFRAITELVLKSKKVSSLPELSLNVTQTNYFHKQIIFRTKRSGLTTLASTGG